MHSWKSYFVWGWLILLVPGIAVGGDLRELQVEVSYAGQAVSYNLYKNDTFVCSRPSGSQLVCIVELDATPMVFLLTAVDARGVESMPSSPFILAPPQQAPAPAPAPVASPANVMVAGNDADGSYTVSWGASVTDGVIYTLEEATNSTFSAGQRLVFSGTALLTSITGRRAGTTYFYRVKAAKSGCTDSTWAVGTNGCYVSAPDNDVQGEFFIAGSDSGSNEALFLTAQIDVLPSDIGQAGSIYVAAQLPSSLGGGWYFYNGTYWVRWTGGPLPEYSFGYPLVNTTISILDGLDASSLGGTSIIVGYGRSETDMLVNQKYTLIYKIQSQVSQR